jgi:hypothetical protein
VGGGLALTVALLHFPGLEVKLGMLGSGYNATYLAMRWKLSGLKPARPQSPYHRMFPHRSSASHLTVLETSSADSLGTSFLSFFCVPTYFFYSFPMGCEIRINECCKTIQE